MKRGESIMSMVKWIGAVVIFVYVGLVIFISGIIILFAWYPFEWKTFLIGIPACALLLTGAGQVVLNTLRWLGVLKS